MGRAAAVGATSGDAVGSVVGVGAAGASTVIATDGAATWPAALNQLATGMAKAMATPSAAATGARNESERPARADRCKRMPVGFRACGAQSRCCEHAEHQMSIA